MVISGMDDPSSSACSQRFTPAKWYSGNSHKLALTMPIAFVIRRVILLTLLVLPQRYWLAQGARLAVRLPRWRRVIYLFLIVAAVGMVLVLTDRILDKFLPDAISHLLAPVTQTWIFTSTFAFFLIQAVRGIGLLWTKCRNAFRRDRPEAPDTSRRSFLRRTAAIMGAAPFLAGIYGYVFERLRFEVVRVDVLVSNLAAELDGLRIVQLSDVHIGDYMLPREVRRAIDLANGLGAHLAVVTGDFVTSRGDPLQECIAELGRLRAPLGVWGCNGNHEIYAGAEEETERLFRLHGMRLLRQAASQIHWNGGTFNLIGVDYQHDIELTGSKMPTLNGAESLVRPDMANILLAHNPNVFHSAAAVGVELSLAGHTHGGQVNIEILNHSWSTARFMSRFVAGLYKMPLMQKPKSGSSDYGAAYLYVNRGLGTLGFPVRVGSAPEITLLTLRSSARAGQAITRSEEIS